MTTLKKSILGLSILLISLYASSVGLIASYYNHKQTQNFSTNINSPEFFLGTPQTLPLPLWLDFTYAQNLASISKRLAGQSSHGFCMRWVRKTVGKALNNEPAMSFDQLPLDQKNTKNPSSTYTSIASAEAFKKWATKNPISLCRSLKLANITQHSALHWHDGLIMVYGKGRCGFHPNYGHIEILTDANPLRREACSDHCRIVDEDCQPDLVLAPVLDCDSIQTSA